MDFMVTVHKGTAFDGRMHLDESRFSILTNAVKNVLATPAAKEGLRKLLGGLDNVSVEAAASPFLDLGQLEAVGDGNQQRFLLKPLLFADLKFPMSLVEAFSAAREGEEAFYWLLLRLVILAVHQVGAYFLRPKVRPIVKDEDRSVCPEFGGAYARRFNVSMWIHTGDSNLSPAGPGDVGAQGRLEAESRELRETYAFNKHTFSNENYTDTPYYPRGMADVVGFWFETEVFGGVPLFFETQYGVELLLHPASSPRSGRVFMADYRQLQGLLRLLTLPLSGAASPLPFSCATTSYVVQQRSPDDLRIVMSFSRYFDSSSSEDSGESAGEEATTSSTRAGCRGRKGKGAARRRHRSVDSVEGVAAEFYGTGARGPNRSALGGRLHFSDGEGNDQAVYFSDDDDLGDDPFDILPPPRPQAPPPPRRAVNVPLRPTTRGPQIILHGSRRFLDPPLRPITRIVTNIYAEGELNNMLSSDLIFDNAADDDSSSEYDDSDTDPDPE